MKRCARRRRCTGRTIGASASGCGSSCSRGSRCSFASTRNPTPSKRCCTPAPATWSRWKSASPPCRWCGRRAARSSRRPRRPSNGSATSCCRRNKRGSLQSGSRSGSARRRRRRRSPPRSSRAARAARLPSPLGPSGPQPTRLFFPTGMAKAGGGVLLVANGNSNRAFEAGTVVSVGGEALDGLLSSTLDCAVSNPDPACTAPIQPAQFFADAVMIGNYAGPLILNTDKTAAYTGSRDSGKINAVRVGPGGSLGCPANAGDDARKDCRAGIIDLRSAGVDGPYAIAAGNSVLPGKAAQNVLFVSSIIPHIDAISGGAIISSTAVAALSMQDPSQLLFTMQAGGFFLDGGGGGGAPGVRREARPP